MPTFSELTITFENDWVDGDWIKFSTWLDESVYQGGIWNFVTTRSTGFEVTSGSPTANPGETSAINFKAAFDLDFPTGYVTAVQNDNEVLIQSETEGEDFRGGAYSSLNTGTATFEFENYSEAPTAETIAEDGAMLTRSPHYVNTPFVFDTTTKVTIALYVWDGAIGSVPATATQTFTKVRPTINYAEFNTDLADKVAAYIDETPIYDIAATTQIVDSNTDNVKWVYFLATYTDASATIADIEGYRVAIDGYGYYSEGVNPTYPANACLAGSAYRKVDRNSFILFPFVNNGTITSIDIDSDGGEINETETPATTTQSAQYVQYVSVDISQAATDDYITITANPGGDAFVYEIVDECKYAPMTVVFKNKYGVFETVTMFKKQTTSLAVESEVFVNNYISAGAYTTTKHQYQKLNVVGKEKITLNSGYIKESENELYKQMLLSDRVYFYSSAYVPVNVATSSLEYKTRINDSLVMYTIEFDYAYNTVNNV